MISADQLYAAYAHGIFPMADSRDDADLKWYDPDPRGVMPIDSFKIPSRLKRTVQQQIYTVSINQDFTGVMRACAAPAPGREATWISEAIIALYSELHQQSRAHSIEVWQDKQMVGGLYGVSIGGAFCGESMFSTARDASKVALVHLMLRLKLRGYLLCDTQFTTPHLAQFGGHEIAREDYHQNLSEALKLNCQFADEADGSIDGNASLVLGALSG